MQGQWAQSGFANTDLDMLIKTYGASKIVVVGLRVNTCIESTARYCMELGYRVTLITDATAGFNWKEMDAAHLINAPTFAHAMMNTADSISAVHNKSARRHAYPDHKKSKLLSILRLNINQSPS